MKNLADFKRELKIGSKWKTFNHLFNKDFGVREVAYKDTVKVGFKGENGKISYLDYPKANKIEIKENKVDIYENNGELILTYELIENENKERVSEIKSYLSQNNKTSAEKNLYNLQSKGFDLEEILEGALDL